VNGANGSSGTSGVNGANGSSGTSGVNGANGSSGTSGAQGPQGPAGTSGSSGSSGVSGGGASCPDVVRIAAMSGRFTVASLNAPNLAGMFSGNFGIGWSYGLYDDGVSTDGSGVLLSIKNDNSYLAIPLPTDFVPGDIIKICGNAKVSQAKLGNDNFYVGVGYVSCSDLLQGGDPLINTLIPTSATAYTNPGVVCFSEQVELNQILPACDTLLIVAMTSANDSEIQVNTRFTYTLDGIKYCNGPNLLIRLCCDQAYSEVIVNNGVAVGASFVDTDGYCWTVYEETQLSVTGIRTKSIEYGDCEACTFDNPCAPNYEVRSCCEIENQVFVPVLPGVGVGDTFVDTYGNCWSVEGTVYNPITNVVYADTVYTETNCDDEVCIDDNPCPTFYVLQSCCIFRNNDALGGITSSAIIGTTYAVNDVFVDQFGFCWKIKAQLETPEFPSLAFISPTSDYIDCDACLTTNPCPESVFYVLQECCTGDIEVWESGDAYNIGATLAVFDPTDTIKYCYKILSFDFTGPATITFGTITGNYSDCQSCIENWTGPCP